MTGAELITRLATLSWTKRIALGLGVVVALTAAVATAIIGPRNVVGMLLYDTRHEGSLKVGDTAPDVSVMSLDGKRRTLLGEWSGTRPVVLVFGSYT